MTDRPQLICRRTLWLLVENYLYTYVVWISVMYKSIRDKNINIRWGNRKLKGKHMKGKSACWKDIYSTFSTWFPECNVWCRKYRTVVYEPGFFYFFIQFTLKLLLQLYHIHVKKLKYWPLFMIIVLWLWRNFRLALWKKI